MKFLLHSVSMVSKLVGLYKHLEHLDRHNLHPKKQFPLQTKYRLGCSVDKAVVHHYLPISIEINILLAKTYQESVVITNKTICIWASSRENLSSGFANNTGADQPAHPRSLISAFVFRLLESTICKLATGEISIR